MRSDLKNTYEIGQFAEWRARWFLRCRGFKILESRYITGRYTGRAEIDIIARRKNLILFIEVKERKSIMDAMAAITSNQTRRLRNAAENYLLKINWQGDARFDAIIIADNKIHWMKEFL